MVKESHCGGFWSSVGPIVLTFCMNQPLKSKPHFLLIISSCLTSFSSYFLLSSDTFTFCSFFHATVLLLNLHFLLLRNRIEMKKFSSGFISHFLLMHSLFPLCTRVRMLLQRMPEKASPQALQTPLW